MSIWLKSGSETPNCANESSLLLKDPLGTGVALADLCGILLESFLMHHPEYLNKTRQVPLLYPCKLSALQKAATKHGIKKNH